MQRYSEEWACSTCGVVEQVYVHVISSPNGFSEDGWRREFSYSALSEYGTTQSMFLCASCREEDSRMKKAAVEKKRKDDDTKTQEWNRVREEHPIAKRLRGLKGN